MKPTKKSARAFTSLENPTMKPTKRLARVFPEIPSENSNVNYDTMNIIEVTPLNSATPKQFLVPREIGEQYMQMKGCISRISEENAELRQQILLYKQQNALGSKLYIKSPPVSPSVQRNMYSVSSVQPLDFRSSSNQQIYGIPPTIIYVPFVPGDYPPPS
ncbi:hypothetical protein CANTEDRAFT_94765 [Yamadazyma tenuis ATCC 10573]|uniref:Uncharacterized protein n=1 Tax=Candida tenuis (strain ATCC 10573 / BCRC 21748 / CBS 615 / JCM 9827 / NBRC 10315 / NRRL Y-1498 / VKM Y-70) TaxID=590646 RepID=G3B9H6_CANTC|nr:uncharacterized protein CANTEDRAFT_94765 [Yamadazyma tenuis ATCC 10573]EGV61887.1 hypothetical protein CANTEDRAFT_94765 [Yamadazyma tenuis ATCC 10573]